MKVTFPTCHAQSKALIISILTTLVMASCVTNKKTTYLQEFSESEEIEDVTPSTYRIQPNDNLFVRVTTPDPRWSAMFNTLPVTSATMSIGEQAVDLLSYPVQLDGTVEIPYLGVVEVVGKTLPEVKESLETTLKDYVTDAAITVKLVNNYVSIVGEVYRPGRYLIYKERMNIFQAIALAGDLTDYGDRGKVQIVRKSIDGTVITDFNLNDKSIVYSEDFYVMPNDVIYVQPMKGKFFSMDEFPYALIFSTVTTFLLILNYFQ